MTRFLVPPIVSLVAALVGVACARLACPSPTMIFPIGWYPSSDSLDDGGAPTVVDAGSGSTEDAVL